MSEHNEQVEPDEDEATHVLSRTGATVLGERLAAMVEAEATVAEAEPEPEPGPLRMPHDPHTATCPDCQGFGETLTGSMVDGQETRTCVGCDGRGWVEIPYSADSAADGELRPIRRDPATRAWTWS